MTAWVNRAINTKIINVNGKLCLKRVYLYRLVVDRSDLMAYLLCKSVADNRMYYNIIQVLTI